MALSSGSVNSWSDTRIPPSARSIERIALSPRNSSPLASMSRRIVASASGGAEGSVKAPGASARSPAKSPSSGVPTERSFSSVTTSSAIHPHRSNATGHRGWNRHPGGMSEGSGRSPFAGELGWISEQGVPRRPQACIGERLLDAGFRLRAVPAQAVHDQRLRDDVVHGMLRIQRLVRILEDDLELLSQAADLDPLETFLPQAVPNQDPADEDGHPDGEEISAQHREGLIPPRPGLVESAGVDVSGEDEAEVRAQVEREDRQPSQDQRDPRRRPGRWHAPEVRDEQRDDDAVADIAPAIHEGEMEHGCRDEGGDGRRDERSDREEDPQEDEVRDGPRPMLFPGERVLPPDGLQVRGPCARLRRLVLVQDGLRHADEDVAPGRRDELQDPLAGRRLATAALPDEAEDLAPPDVEVHAIDRADVFRRGFPQRLEESPPLLEPDAEVPQDEIRFAGHLPSPPSAAGSWCSGGMRRSGPLRPGRDRVPGRCTAARRTCTGDGSGTRGAG